jgi:hypothetical protein
VLLDKDAAILAAQDGEDAEAEVGEIRDRLRIEHGGVQHAVHHSGIRRRVLAIERERVSKCSQFHERGVKVQTHGSRS